MSLTAHRGCARAGLPRLGVGVSSFAAALWKHNWVVLVVVLAIMLLMEVVVAVAAVTATASLPAALAAMLLVLTAQALILPS